jgi:hypothetical protein
MRIQIQSNSSTLLQKNKRNLNPHSQQYLSEEVINSNSKILSNVKNAIENL